MRLHADGRLAEAEAAYRQLMKIGDVRPAVLHWLGMVLYQTGHVDEALPLLRRSVDESPESAEFNANFGGVLNALGRSSEGLPYSRRSVEMAPKSPKARYNLGAVLESLGKYEEALAEQNVAVELDPSYAHAHTGRGNVLRKLGRATEATTAHRRAIELRPEFADAYNNLAKVLMEVGDVPGTLNCYRKLVDLRPDHAGYHSNLVALMHYADWHSPSELFEEARRWAARHAEPLTAKAPRPCPTPCAEKLTIGYLSEDFREHPVGRLMEPVIERLDRRRFRVVCYCDVSRPDEITARIRQKADVWREVAGTSHESLARQISADHVDILVDTTGHFGNNRLSVFARRPAPVQVSHFGYCGTTGMSAIHWRLTDAHSDPPGTTEHLHTEKLLRLPDTTWCYRPIGETPDVGPLPALSTGYITFCCLNNLIKITERVLATWSRVLDRVRGSRLLLLSKFKDNELFARRLERCGIPLARVDLLGQGNPAEYLEYFNRADIALDPFPFNGDNTTCDALWMGVPVVTLAGEMFCSRRGVSHLRAIGLTSLIASSPDSYINIASSLALDLDRLALVRSGLRSMMETSPLTDAAQFTRNLEAAYEAMAVQS